jgi:5-methylcytosine-specific restriction endonuclease McrA
MHDSTCCLYARLKPSSGYRYGCRCDRCAAWHRDWQAQYRHRGTGVKPDPAPCDSCGSVFQPTNSNHRFCSSLCSVRSSRNVAPRVCRYCGKDFMRSSNRPICAECSPIAKRESWRRKNMRRRGGDRYRHPIGPTLDDIGPIHGPSVPVTFLCGCGVSVVKRSANHKRCKECARRRDIERTCELYFTSRLVDNVPRAMRWRRVLVDYLAERDGPKCALCKKKMRFDLPSGPRGDDRAPSIDHVIPRSLDGGHGLENLQLAHWGCNRAKQTTAMGEQLRLVG